MIKNVSYDMGHSEWDELKELLIKEGYKVKSDANYDSILDKESPAIIGQAILEDHSVRLLVLSDLFKRKMESLEERVQKS
ncbi:MAG: hypothetical protein NTW17_03475 [Candidatus Pacearchaeota archaeon]|nr:hypothetical protein [Candidatus Pacearchaeota archaeon]